jgi:hypothetical protein
VGESGFAVAAAGLAEAGSVAECVSIGDGVSAVDAVLSVAPLAVSAAALVGGLALAGGLSIFGSMENERRGPDWGDYDAYREWCPAWIVHFGSFPRYGVFNYPHMRIRQGRLFAMRHVFFWHRPVSGNRASKPGIMTYV